jgi:hypothetical protein
MEAGMLLHSRRDFFVRLGAGWLGASLMERAVARYGEYVAGQLGTYGGAHGTPAEVLAEALKENVASAYRALERN